MPLDGLFLHHLTNELQKCVGCRADKIHQPTRDELVLLLRSAAFTGKLLISTRSGSARLHITEGSFDNPAEPPSFCKLLRRHLSSAKITAVEQNGLDRTVIIRFMTYNEMGDTIYPFLAVELITGRANVVLCEENGRIMDALHRSDIESSARLIQPGAKYTFPPKEEKANPLTETAEFLARKVEASGRPLSSAFTAAVDGVSPLVSRELAALCGLDPDLPPDSDGFVALAVALKRFKEQLSAPLPTIMKDKDGEFKDFSYMKISQYGEELTCSHEESFSKLLDRFFAGRDTAARMKAAAVDLFRGLNNARNRNLRKTEFRRADLAKCENREQLRIFGELLKANIYAVPKGAESVRVQNYYDENLGFVDIPLDPALSPANNAAKYFKDYKKTYTAEQTLTELIEKDQKELVYIDSVLDALTRAKTASELSVIRDELTDTGYISAKNDRRRKTETKAEPKEFTSANGFRVLVGRNNRENDLLTTKTAAKTDLWFHTKNIPGSHVILFTEGREPEPEDLLFAASLAAGHSKAADSDNVPVDFTEVKNVKKPSGARPGMVIYTTNKTIYAKPYKSDNF